MTLLQAIILGAVEGVTEFLPISSTGHLILTGRLLVVADGDFLKSFEVAIQLGAILAVVVWYWRALFLSPTVIKKVGAAFLPTAVIGFILYRVIKQYLLNNAAVVLWALFLGGALIIAFEWWYGRREEHLLERGGSAFAVTEVEGKDQPAESVGYAQAVVIGLCQSLAVIPGVSRAAATIIGGRLLGVKRRAIVEFSFLLAVPTMAAAALYDLYQSAGAWNGGNWLALAVGFAMSFITALLAVKWLLRFIKQHSFLTFGVYRIIIAAVFWWLFF